MGLEDQDMERSVPRVDLSQADWGAIAEGAADRTTEKRRSSTFWQRLQEIAIAEGRGVGDHGDAPLGDAFDPNVIVREVQQLLGVFGQDESAAPDQALVSELVRINWMNGEITEQQAIATLMENLGLNFDAAVSRVEIWDKEMQGAGGGGGVDDPLQDLMDLLFGDGLGSSGSGSRGGGGGGGVARQYVGPDRGLVEDWVKGQLIRKVGKADDDRVKMLTEVYLGDDRKNFGIVSGESIDPKQSVVEKIREFDDYKRIHANRTDAQDEDTWISGQMSALLGAGVSGAEAEKLAINFAQAGVSQARAGELSEARRVGNVPSQKLPGFFQNVQRSLSTVARSVR